MKIKLGIKGAASDSILLTFVRVITAVLGLAVTKLLSVHFSLKEYGTYSQAMLIVTTATSFSVLGLTNAVNFFYNKINDKEKKEEYISTIFGIQYVVGILCAIIILLLQVPIINYFNNSDLKEIIFLVACFPLLENLLPMLQVLFVSIGKAKIIAVRNFIISVVRLLIVIFACFVTQSIYTIFLVLLISDLVQVIYFMISFAKRKFRIQIIKFKRNLVPVIMEFSIPMAVYVLTNELTRDIDRYVVGFFADTETLGIYTNAAKLLPFDLVTASFITVLIPIITRQIGNKENQKAIATFRAYLRFGYLITWMLAFGAVIVAKELMIFLYDEKFLPGLAVFVIYLFVDMIKFANTSLILTATGKTKILMYCSIGSLVFNLIFNIITYKMIGIIGPALTTLCITFGLTVILLKCGAKELGCRVVNFFDCKELLNVTMQFLVIGIICYIIKILIKDYINSTTIILVIVYGIFVGVVSLLNIKKIMNALRNISAYK